MADFELYAWTKGTALAPVLCLEEAKVSYHLIPSNPDSRTVVKELKKVNPLGDIPVLIDKRDGRRNVSVFGSSAIMQYLALELNKLLPTSPPLYATALQWLFWQERVIQGNILIYESCRDGRDDKTKAKCTAILRQSLKKLDSWLKNKPYIASEFSITDIALFFLIRKPENYGLLISEFPNLRDWMTRMHNRVATKKSLAITFY